MIFSSAISILKDIKKKSSWDIIKIIEKLDDKPITFDFGSGNIIVIRYVIETYDARILLFVPAVKSFMKKIQIGKYFELGSKRTYNYELTKRKSSDWIIYVNRIKNLNQIKFTLKQRIKWQKNEKLKDINFPFDENWLEKCLPIKNNLDDCKDFFVDFKNVDRDTLLSLPLKILRLQFNKQIEVTEKTGSVIKNLEYYGLTEKKKIIKIYVPYFLKDLVSNLIEKFLNFNIVINRLKIFYKKNKDEIYGGFLWDPTLSGFITLPKKQEEKILSIKDGLFEHDEKTYNEDIFVLTEEFKEMEKNVNGYGRKNDKKKRFRNGRGGRGRGGYGNRNGNGNGRGGYGNDGGYGGNGNGYGGNGGYGNGGGYGGYKDNYQNQGYFN